MSIRSIRFEAVSRWVPAAFVLAAVLALAPAAFAVCGNGVVETGEDCDDGSSNNGSSNSCCTTNCKFANKNPDVIVGDLIGVSHYGTFADTGISAFAVGTTSCNLGSCWLNWMSGIAEHPVIGQNMFRLKDGRFEQIGQSWLKHGFTALQGNVCSSSCNSAPDGTHLGVNCSDPYSSSLNGGQTRLGPKVDVNPSTGVYPFPDSRISTSGNAIFKRLQVHHTDLNPATNAGALYFVEGQYVTHDDATAKANANNASYRPANVTVGTTVPYNLALTGSTQRQKAGIQAWKATDPTVTETSVSVPGDGLYIVSAKATSLGGGIYHYEYAVQNLTSNRAGQSFSVPIPASAVVTNVGFHDVDYHSGEPFDGTDWTPAVTANSVSWSTQTYLVNPLANALRWGTLYNFRFDANVTPGTSPVTITLFKSGGTASVSVSTVAPGSCLSVETSCGDGLDEDCDGRTDCADTDCCASGACAAGDADGDHFAAACDCNDTNAAIYPGAPQLCDGLNNNCSAAGWPAVPTNELDGDGDGVRGCAGDCDDTSSQRYPGNPEICDGIDNDCTGGLPANELDGDGDGVRACADCDDSDPRRYPGNTEICDGVDNRCTGTVLPVELDVDADGSPICAGDCNDSDPRRYPGNPEICDGIDNDCVSGVPVNEDDGDADGFRLCAGDCDDADSHKFPGNPESCDGIDNDCYGGVPAAEGDANHDGTMDCLVDCDSGNESVWATPGEVQNVQLAKQGGTTVITWAPPLVPGGSTPRYDTIRSSDSSNFVDLAECIEADGTDTVTFDSVVPADGAVSYYLIRTENDCPYGVGPLGYTSTYVPRSARPCP